MFQLILSTEVNPEKVHKSVKAPTNSHLKKKSATQPVYQEIQFQNQRPNIVKWKESKSWENIFFDFFKRAYSQMIENV